MSPRYLLDSGPAQDFVFKRHGMHLRVNQARVAGSKVGICTPVLGEVMGGLEYSDRRETALPLARRRLPKLLCWPYDKAAAHTFGRIFADLKRRGRPIQHVDMQLAAIALTLGNCVVVSGDADLLAVPGLTVENWAAE